MKLLILGDTHFGARNSSSTFNDYFKSVIENEIFPLLKARKIDTILQMGDLFDNRKTVSFPILAEVRKYFFQRLQDENIHLVTLVGNHDSANRDTISINSQRLLLGDFDNVTIVDSPYEFGNILVVPWICEDNKAVIEKAIVETNLQYCAGHFELAGFSMYRGGEKAKKGQSPDDLKKFQTVFSGHYHTSSRNGNILYVGTPYEITWADYADQKYVWIFDDTTGELEPVPIQTKMFYTIEYGADKPVPDHLKGKSIKIIVDGGDKDFGQFEKFVSAVSEQSPLELRVVMKSNDTLDQQVNKLTTSSLTDTIEDYFKSSYRGEEKKSIFMNFLNNLAL
jgi:DNA repair exonuclease SbcCD nuclease subunit